MPSELLISTVNRGLSKNKKTRGELRSEAHMSTQEEDEVADEMIS